MSLYFEREREAHVAVSEHARFVCGCVYVCTCACMSVCLCAGRDVLVRACVRERLLARKSTCAIICPQGHLHSKAAWHNCLRVCQRHDCSFAACHGSFAAGNWTC